MLNLELRDVLLAKTALKYNKIETIHLITIAVEEAKLMKKNNNPGHKNNIVIKQRAIKIFKNLLKHYNSKQLIEFMNPPIKFIYMSNHIKKLSKRKIIDSIVSSNYKQFTSLIKAEK